MLLSLSMRQVVSMNEVKNEDRSAKILGKICFGYEKKFFVQNTYPSFVCKVRQSLHS